jgi:hypothetical protein
VVLPQQIPFEIVVNGKLKEFLIVREMPWKDVLHAIGDITFQHPASLRLGYFNPFRPKKSGKAIPNSLENEQEWQSLLGHIQTYHAEQQAKNKGKGGVIKKYVITLADLDSGDAQVCLIHLLLGSSAHSFQKKGARSKQITAPAETSDADSVSAQQVKIIKELRERWHCNTHGRFCIIDPGPPPSHKSLTMPEIHRWATLVVSKPSIQIDFSLIQFGR